jgi:hypothetical protein
MRLTCETDESQPLPPVHQLGDTVLWVVELRPLVLHPRQILGYSRLDQGEDFGLGGGTGEDDQGRGAQVEIADYI